MAEKKDYTKLKAIAKEFFMNGMSRKEIAELTGVSEVSISKWSNEEVNGISWNDEKSQLTFTPVKIRQMLLKEVELIANGEKSSINSDQLIKIVNSIEKLDKKVSVRIIVDVLKELDNWMTTVDPKQALEFTKMHKQFIAYRISLES